MKYYQKIILSLFVFLFIGLLKPDSLQAAEVNPSGLSSYGYAYTMGFRFTPNSNGTITKLWCYSGSSVTVTLWSDAGSSLASGSCSGTWGSIDINVPVSQGTYYRVSTYTTQYIGTINNSYNYGNVTVDQGYYNTGGYLFPNSAWGTNTGAVDITFSADSGGTWTYLGVGNSTYSGTTSWTTLGTIPAGASYVALARYAMETEQTLTGDEVNYSVTINGASTCTADNDGPWAGSSSPEKACNVVVTTGDWTDSSGLTPDCQFRYVLSTRVVQYYDTVTNEDCGLAVYYYTPNTAPTITVNPSPSYSSYTRTGPVNTPFSVNFTATDSEQTGSNALTYYIHTGANRTGTQLATGTFTSGAASVNIAYNTSPLSQGSNTLYLSVYDGTVYSSTNPSFTVYRDDTNPSASGISHNPNPVVSNNQYTTTFTVSDTYSTSGGEQRWWVRTSTGGGGTQLASGTTTAGNQVTTGTITDSTLDGGANSRYVRICDGANNCSDNIFTVNRLNTPTITSPTKSNVTHNSALLGGNITSQGGSSVTARGVCVSTTDTTPTIAEGANCFADVSGGIGIFTVSATGLSSVTAFNFSAYATNTQGTEYTLYSNPDTTFTTLTNLPTGTDTSTATSVSSFYATLRGSANPNGFQTYGHFRVYTANPGNCNSDTGGFRFPEQQVNDIDLGAGTALVTAPTFQFTIPFSAGSFLVPNTSYWYCAYAVGSNGTGGASTVQTFSTPDGPASPCDPPSGGNLTIPATSVCTFSGNYNGVDVGSGTRNTGTMSLAAGSNLTVSSTQQIAFGGLSAVKTATITFQRGATLRGGGLYVHDKDRDGVLDSKTQYIASTASASTEFVRRNTLSTNYNYAWKIASSGASLDCDNNNQYIYRRLPSTLPLVVDADNDGYKTAAAATTTACVGNNSTISGRTYYKDSSNVSSWLPDAQKLSASTDCLDTGTGGQGQAAASVYQNFTGYSDADNDNYTINSTASICSGASILAYNLATNPYRASLSSPVDCQDNPNGAPCAPVNGSGTNGSSPTAAAASTSQINLAWGVNSAGGTVPAATGYDVQICGLNDTTCASYSTQSVSNVTYSYGDGGLACSTSPSYYYRIVAKHSTNGNTNSSIFSGVTSTCCSNGYKDYDGDGYGAGSNSCWNPSASYTVVGTGTDCYDYDGANSTTRTQSSYARPGQTSYYTLKRGAPSNVNDWAGNSWDSWDYNCDGNYTNTLTGGTTAPASMPSRTYCSGTGPTSIYNGYAYCSNPCDPYCCGVSNACDPHRYCSSYTTARIVCGNTYTLFSSGPSYTSYYYADFCSGGNNSNVTGYYEADSGSSTVSCR